MQIDQKVNIENHKKSVALNDLVLFTCFFSLSWFFFFFFFLRESTALIAQLANDTFPEVL